MSKITLIQNTFNNSLKAIKTEDLRRMSVGARLTLNLQYMDDSFVPDLSEKELKLIKDKTGESWMKGDDFNPYWLKYEVVFNSDKQQVLDLTDFRDLIKYKVGIKLGVIAETFEEAKDIMNKSIFYCSNREDESRLEAEKNEVYTDVLFDLTKLKRESDLKLVYVASEILGDLSIVNVSESLNYLKRWLDEKDTTERCKAVAEILKEDTVKLENAYNIKKCISYGLIKKNSRGFYCNAESATEFGKSVGETVNMLCSVKFEEDLGTKDIKNNKKYSVYSMLNTFENKNKKN
jgi:hypothetical protein